MKAARLGWILWIGSALGAQANEVVGGKAVSITECPWTARMSGGCTGSWIGGKWALTAKHCGTQNHVTVGITRRSESNSSNQIRVVRNITHPSADIRLLELEKVPTAPLARPIRLAGMADATYFQPGATTRLSGWGRLSENGSAPDSVHMLDSPAAPSRYQTSTRMYWSGAQNGVPMGACYGDSGGPIAVKDATGAWIEASLVTGGGPVCGNEMPDYGPRIAAYEAWFKEQMGVNPVVIGPRPDSPEMDLSFRNRSFTLKTPQALALSIRDFTGKEVWATRAFFPAGAHDLPKEAIGSGPALVSVQGSNLKMARIIRD
jgi:hypothetical protein